MAAKAIYADATAASPLRRFAASLFADFLQEHHNSRFAVETVGARPLPSSSFCK
jgi:hypothetical protein